MNRLRIIKGDGDFAEEHRDTWLPIISDYIDDTLPAQEIVRLQAHLKECDKCEADLEGMRQATFMLRRLPEIPAPRSFTLTPAQAKRLKPSPFYRFSQIAAAVAAILLLFAFSLDMSGTFSTPKVDNTLAVASPNPTATLPGIGTLAAADCSKTGGSNCGFGVVTVNSDPATTAPDPTKTPSPVQVAPGASDSSVPVVRWLEVALVVLALLFAAFAIALRPRAPSKLRL
ncbi:MAG TPA: zf-HC2 domain-containing protein [Chloroflexia bacterium]|nr:zf-HC2 domain-containing protein [Chloroflexia bacterium]